MIGRTNAGGALANAFAVIGAAYPAGSVCTCTNGTKTIKAKDTSGSYLFLIPEAGTWTVTATDGTDTAEEVVEVTTKYQSASIVLAYRLTLYDPGRSVINTFTTEGFSYKNSSTSPTLKPAQFADNGEYLHFKRTDAGVCIAGYEDAIDVTDYAALFFEIENTLIASSNKIGLQIDVSTTKNMLQDRVALYQAKSALNVRTEDSLDLSAISGPVYISAHSSSSQGGKIYRMWLKR